MPRKKVTKIKPCLNCGESFEAQKNNSGILFRDYCPACTKKKVWWHG